MSHLDYLRLIATMACSSLSPAVADQVVLKNGDRVTGTIVKKDAKDLTIKTAFGGRRGAGGAAPPSL